MSETLEVGGLTFDVRRSVRRKTLGLTVDRGGELVVYAPEDAATSELVGWARSRLLWVHGKLASKQALGLKVRQPEFVTGESFRYLGRNYRLRLVDQQSNALRLDGETFLLRRDARSAAGEHFRRWYRANGLPWLQERICSLAPRVGSVPERIQIRELGFRWGSCTRDGDISLHWKLLQLPTRLIDYVIIHELVHLTEPHHGRQFRMRLDCALPDWRERQEDLARSGAAYLRL
jgi:predicted metal-dependent hydrolase